MSASALLDLPPSYLEVTYRDCVDTVLDLYLFAIPSELIREAALVRLQRFIPLIKHRLDSAPIHLQDSRWMVEFKEILSAIYEVIPNWPEFRGCRHPRGSSFFGRFDSFSLHVHIGYNSMLTTRTSAPDRYAATAAELRRKREAASVQEAMRNHIPMSVHRQIEEQRHQRVSLSRYV